jgi:hypothetical protein
MRMLLKILEERSIKTISQFYIVSLLKEDNIPKAIGPDGHCRPASRVNSLSSRIKITCLSQQKVAWDG